MEISQHSSDPGRQQQQQTAAIVRHIACRYSAIEPSLLATVGLPWQHQKCMAEVPISSSSSDSSTGELFIDHLTQVCGTGVYHAHKHTQHPLRVREHAARTVCQPTQQIEGDCCPVVRLQKSGTVQILVDCVTRGQEVLSSPPLYAAAQTSHLWLTEFEFAQSPMSRYRRFSWADKLCTYIIPSRQGCKRQARLGFGATSNTLVGCAGQGETEVQKQSVKC